MMLLLALASAPVWACSAEDVAPPPGVEVSGAVGWSADSQYFVFECRRYDDEGASKPCYGVVDTATDRTTVHDDDGLAALTSTLGLVDGPETQTCGAATRVHTQEDLTGFTEAGHTPWSFDHLTTLGVQVDGRVWVHAEGLGVGSPVSQWAVDCSRIAWWTPGMRMDATGAGVWQRSTALLVMPAGPVVHVMAHNSAENTAQRVFDALRAAGFPAHIGPHALKDREVSVVYASGAARQVARGVALAIPGGARVEPLDWVSAADIVVATGRSVVP